MSTLYEITEELLRLEELFEKRGGEVSDEEFDAYLRLQEDLEAKLDRTVAFVRELEARAKARREEANRLLELARLDEALVARLKDRMMAAMQALGRDRVDTPRFRLSIRAAGGKVPVVLRVERPEELPSRFRRISIAPDLETIRAALEAGDPEAASIAEFGERKRYLSIR
jgi:hypothetical protein